MDNDQIAGQSPLEVSTEIHSVDQPAETITQPPEEGLRSPGEDVQRLASTVDTTSSRNLELLLEEMHALREDFDTKVKYDDSKQRLIDTLHNELQIYREDLHFKLLRPIFMDLITMHDDLGKLIDALLSGNVDTSVEQSIKNMQSFQETIEEILQKHGVNTFNSEGVQFFPGKQRVLMVVDAPDPAFDKQVAHRVRKGFQYGDRVLRPELVNIYKIV